MATLKPFAALRPKPELAAQICELPYDVMSSDEARELAAGNPLSFLHVSKPEIDLPPGTDLYSPASLCQGPGKFPEAHLAGRAANRTTSRIFILYRQIMGEHSQIGLVAAASCEEYLAGHHQEARADPPGQGRRPRAPHRSAQFADRPGFSDVSRRGGVGRVCRQERPRNTRTWISRPRTACAILPGTLRDPTEIKFIESQFAQIPFLYIADGHHRSAAAARVFQARNGAGRQRAVSRRDFSAQPDADSALQPRAERFERLVRRTNCWRSSEAFLQCQPAGGPPALRASTSSASSSNGKWHTLSFKPQITAAERPD